MYQIKGKIDSNNAGDFEKEIMAVMPKEIDASELNYISSAGLRILMKLRKAVGEVTISKVSSEVYEIFDVTGFTQLITVNKRLREITVDDTQLLGAGANGRVYRIDPERIVKVYNSVSNPPEKIKREQASARQAFIHGIPSAIPFDIVKVGNELGMIYELINAQTLGQAVHREPHRLEEYALKMSSLLKQLHSTEIEKGIMPDARDTLKVWADIAANSDYFRKDDIQKVYELINSIPFRNTIIHGDYHPGNIMVSDDELILIDMGDVSLGHPIIDLLGIYQLMSLIPKRNEKAAMRYTGMTTDEVIRMWNIFIRDYIGTNEKKVIEEFERSLKCYALIRSIGGMTFSDVIPDEKRRIFSAYIMKEFLTSYEESNFLTTML